MKRFFLTMLLALPLLTVMIPGCTSAPGSVNDYDGLVDALNDAIDNPSVAVKPGGEVEQPFFDVRGRIIGLEGGDIQVFEYPDAAAAEAQAATVSPDGYSVGNTQIGWIEPPHFYRSGKIIVIYIGSDEGTLALLEDVLGPQFAGS